MSRHSPGRLLLVWLGCTLLLTAGDQFHTQFGVITYANPGPLWGQAWWVAPLFALATLGFVFGAWPFAPKAQHPAPRDFVSSILWFFGSYAASGVFGRYSLTLAVLYTAIFLARIARRGDRGVLAAFGALLAVTGTLAESALHYVGVCRYDPRDFLLVPLWLPALYLQGAPLVLAIARWLRFPAPASRLSAPTPGACARRWAVRRPDPQRSRTTTP